MRLFQVRMLDRSNHLVCLQMLYQVRYLHPDLQLQGRKYNRKHIHIFSYDNTSIIVFLYFIGPYTITVNSGGIKRKLYIEESGSLYYFAAQIKRVVHVISLFASFSDVFVNRPAAVIPDADKRLNNRGERAYVLRAGA